MINDASKIHFMAIFLLPGVDFPQNAAASVYVQVPGRDFQLLGLLSAEKQSAIFKFNTDTMMATHNDVDEMMDDDEESKPDKFDINVGISIEPLQQAQEQLATLRQSQVAKPKMLSQAPEIPSKPAPRSSEDIATLANKIVGYAYNYLAGFVDNAGKVPMKAFDDWWAKFKTRIAADPNFLDSVET